MAENVAKNLGEPEPLADEGFGKLTSELVPAPFNSTENLPNNEKNPDPELVILAEEWKREVEARGDEFVAYNFKVRGHVLAKIRVKAKEGTQNGAEQTGGTLLLVLKSKKNGERILGGGKLVIGEERIGTIFKSASSKEQFDQFGVEEWKREVEAKGDSFEPIDKDLPYRVIGGKILAKIRKKSGELFAILKGMDGTETAFPEEGVVASEETVNTVANCVFTEDQFTQFIKDMRKPLIQIADSKKNI